MPLWNFLIFFFLPKKTILGPITGGYYKGPVINLSTFLRKYILILFYKLSLFILKKKFKYFLFSTNLLKKFTCKNIKKKIIFNFVLLAFERKKITKKKKYDLIFYNNNHATKKTSELVKALDILSKNFKICVFGDYYNNNNVINFGFVSRNKVYNLLSESKIAIASSENFFSLFVIDALNCKNFILFQKDLSFYDKIISKYCIFVDYKNNFSILKKITYLLQIKYSIKDFLFEKKIYRENINIHKFMKKYLLIKKF